MKEVNAYVDLIASHFFWNYSSSRTVPSDGALAYIGDQDKLQGISWEP